MCQMNVSGMQIQHILGSIAGYADPAIYGEVSEWFKETVLKTVDV